MADEVRLRDGLEPRANLAAPAEPGAQRRAPEPVATYAALDLGTNNCRLLIARPSHDGFRVVDSFSRIIRLGEGLTTTRHISEAAIERAVSALSVCSEKIRAKGAKRVRTIATEACRAADNSDAFLALIKLEIIDRETESTFAVIGCSPLLDPQANGAILFDIGGGSTEVVRIERPQGQPHAPPVKGPWVSLPLGVVTLAERYGGHDVSQEIYAAMTGEVFSHLEPFASEHGGGLSRMHLLGTSGTVTTVAGIHLGLSRYDRRKVDGLWMTDGEIDRAIAQLMSMSYHDRAANACIGTERADLVLAGCAILDAIRKAFPLPKLRVADRGLREGMLVEMMRADGVLQVS
jgi:exopolyphosphatase/guanosine-5'-triphosphate,3'-diphosphate pyrophosphatase